MVQESESSSMADGKRVSTYRGVSWSKQTHKWQAEIEVDGSIHFIGTSADEEEAARMVDRALLQRPGPTGPLNFPEADYYDQGSTRPQAREPLEDAK